MGGRCRGPGNSTAPLLPRPFRSSCFNQAVAMSQSSCQESIWLKALKRKVWELWAALFHEAEPQAWLGCSAPLSSCLSPPPPVLAQAGLSSPLKSVLALTPDGGRVGPSAILPSSEHFMRLNSAVREAYFSSPASGEIGVGGGLSRTCQQSKMYLPLASAIVGHWPVYI